MKRSHARAAVALAAASAIAVGISLVWLGPAGSGLAGRLAERWADINGSADQAGAVAGEAVVTVYSGGQGTPISPLIYGVAFADSTVLGQLGATVDRWGGNTATSYNWVTHSWNAGRDWEFRNKPADNADTFVASALAGNATPLLTIPTIGYVARDGDNGTRSVGVPAGGGPPVSQASSRIAGYDPSANRLATSIPSYARKPTAFVTDPAPNPSAVYQDEWVNHLIARFGSGSTGVHLFAMDNEPDIWSSTHTDVHPVRMGYADMVSNFVQYATAVKAVDPAALILGPDVCCWTSMFYSDLDRGTDNFRTHADRNAHGGEAFLPWWLSQIARHDAASRSRSLDFLDVHFYPQADGVFSDRADPATQALRIRSVRSLWDPSYVDESWINTDVQLIPRLRGWIAASYPGTGIAISEYNFGGERDASGAVAEAEALGVFGREGVALATYWTHPAADSAVGGAFRAYRNFDGKGGQFGDRSLTAVSDAPGIRAFASRHSNSNEIDTVVVNESLRATTHTRIGYTTAPYHSVAAFCLQPGTSTIVPVALDSSSAFEMQPLSVCVVKAVQ
ncbi:MAG TPA: glycoside hydrolase family 44 protein [Candidatus Limnocylindrales bacterium]|nr:glycoside hydrolase family 44 protein [Candidatus Limnocylindrales bacterium]